MTDQKQTQSALAAAYRLLIAAGKRRRDRDAKNDRNTGKPDRATTDRNR